MADRTEKHEKNVEGNFYVDKNCISCGQCVAIAPDNFSEDIETGSMYVSTKPETSAAIKACQEAVENCPVWAIGEDGD